MTYWFTLEIHNFYEDGDVITTEETVHAPPMPPDDAAREEWEMDYLFPVTGTGRTEGSSSYSVTITKSNDITAVGHSCEFG